MSPASWDERGDHRGQEAAAHTLYLVLSYLQQGCLALWQGCTAVGLSTSGGWLQDRRGTCRTTAHPPGCCAWSQPWVWRGSCQAGRAGRPCCQVSTLSPSQALCSQAEVSCKHSLAGVARGAYWEGREGQPWGQRDRTPDPLPAFPPLGQPGATEQGGHPGAYRALPQTLRARSEPSWTPGGQWLGAHLRTSGSSGLQKGQDRRGLCREAPPHTSKWSSPCTAWGHPWGWGQLCSDLAQEGPSVDGGWPARAPGAPDSRCTGLRQE